MTVAVAMALFVGGIVMGFAGALMWAWGVRTGQFRDLERSKDQLFWPDLAETDDGAKGAASTTRTPARRT